MVGYDAILMTLQAAAKRRAEPGLELHCDLMRVMSSAVPPAGGPALAAGEAARRLGQGSPLLAAELDEADPLVVGSLCRQVIAVAARHRMDLAAPLDRIGACLDTDMHRGGALVHAYLQGAQVRDIVPADVDHELLTFVLNNALHPMLRACAEALAPMLDDAEWRRGYCPVCGGAPDFAALEKGSGERRLLCSRCDTEWHVPRAGCPFCGDEGPGAYYPAAEGPYRLYVCDTCLGYLKTVDLREAVEARPLAAERILTTGMDVAAREAGYRPGVVDHHGR